ncbi:MAG: M23 family metallopeptidase [Aminobacteriaceae bacterium]
MPSFSRLLTRRLSVSSLSALLLFITCSASCNELPWVEHLVVCGECLDSIAEDYGVLPKTIERANELSLREEPRKLSDGEKILIPKCEDDLTFTLAEVRARKRGESIASTIRDEKSMRLSVSRPAKVLPRPAEQFIRPVAGRITSPWGMRGGRLHDGVDIPAPLGTPILAARSGRVVFSGNINGYGRTVTIDHGDGTRTRYSHNSANLVKVGDVVRQGQPVAKVGRTGRATCTHVHFSVLVNGKAVNPEKYLR